MCVEVLASYLFMCAALCVHKFLLLACGAHRLKGSVWKIRIVLFVYVSVGTVSADDIGHPCLACCVPCARFDGSLNVSAFCSPSLFDGCQALPVERDDNISVECSCKETLLVRFWPSVDAASCSSLLRWRYVAVAWLQQRSSVGVRSSVCQQPTVRML